QPHRGGERRPAAGAGRSRRAGRAPGGAAGTGRGRDGGAGRALPGRALRRPAAAGGDRAGPGRAAAAGARRRAHRRAGHPDRGGGAAAAAGSGRRRRRRRARDPRGPARRLGRPGDLPAGRPGRGHVWPPGPGGGPAHVGVDPVSGILAALRVARREVRRSKGRSLLVLALIGLPVFGAAGTAVCYDMFTLTPQERLERRIGAADAELRWEYDQPIVQRDLIGEWYELARPDQGREVSDRSPSEVEAVLPAGSRVLPRWWGTLRVPTAAGVGLLDWHAFDLADPLTQGIARVVEGRAPADAGEVAVTAAAARRLAVAIGDTLTVPDEGDRRVVGLVEFPGESGSFDPGLVPGLNAQILLFHPDGRPSEHWQPRWLASTPVPVDWEQVRELNQHGIAVLSRAVVLDPPAQLDPYAGAGGPVPVPGLGVGVLIAGLVALEVVLLAGPAFAVGARRRQRDLALVAANGGTPAQLRRIVLADGVVLGSLAAVGGIVLGVGAALAARPWLEVHLVGARAGGYRVFPLALVGIAGFAVVTAVLAAMVPAFTAARQPVVAALAGRRGTT